VTHRLEADLEEARARVIGIEEILEGVIADDQQRLHLTEFVRRQPQRDPGHRRMVTKQRLNPEDRLVAERADRSVTGRIHRREQVEQGKLREEGHDAGEGHQGPNQNLREPPYSTHQP
jgi:hypothetical protein